MSMDFYVATKGKTPEGKDHFQFLPDMEFPNFSNSNAREIANALGFPVNDGLMEAVDISTFKARCTSFLRNTLDKPSAEIPWTETKSPGRCTMIYGGRPQGYLQVAIARILTVVNEGEQKGGQYVYAC